jgi:hypothetical protein
MSRAVYYTYKGELVIEEPCGCRHAGGSYIPRYAADKGKVGMCKEHALQWYETHERAAREHKDDDNNQSRK